MRKPKRKKIDREWLENQLAKYERRIQKLAENAYTIRQAIYSLDQQEAQQTVQVTNQAVSTEIQQTAINAVAESKVE